MKKLLLFLATALTIQINTYGQAVPSGTFENWNSTSYKEANGWTTGNLKDIQRMETTSVTEVAGFSGFGIRIQTNIAGSDTSESFIINTTNPCSDPSQWTGGVPYSQQPTAITGYYRYSLPGNDSALFIVIFRKNGVHIGDNMIKFRGTGSQLTFTSFSFPVTCTGIPDSMIIAAASSDKISNQDLQNGSFLELDNLAFTGATQIIPNGNFENWTAKSYDVPAGWEMSGNGASQTTNSFAGTYAIRLETTSSSCDGVNSSGITTGHNNNNNGPSGGIPYTNMSDTLSGYYKYTSMGNDTANINVSLTNNGTIVGGNGKWLTAAATYTYFELPFQAGSAPDTIRIDVQSSTWPLAQANAGSVLYLDNLSMKSAPLGIFENKTLQSVYYPNPVRDILYVQFERNFSGTTNLFIYQIDGSKSEVNGVSRNANSMRIDVSSLCSGIYYYEIRTNDGIMRNKFVKE